MSTPPTFVAEYEVSDWQITTTPRTMSVTVAAGDYLVVIAGTEESNNLQTPTGGGLTYTLQQQVTVSSYAGVSIWTAPCASSQTFTLSVAITGGQAFGFNVLRFSGCSGIGASNKTNAASGTPSLGLTASGDNSAIVCIDTDWNAADGASRAWRSINGITPTAGNGLEVTYSRNASRYTVYGAYWSDAGTAGSKTVGLTTPGQKYAIAAVEVLGVAGSSTVNGTATLASTSTLAGSAAVVCAGSATATSSSTLTAAATVALPGQATLTSSSTLTAAAVIVYPGQATLASTSTLTASAGSTANGAATLASTSSLTAAATVRVNGTATLASASTLAGAASVIVPASAVLASTSTLTANTTGTVPGTATLASTSTLTGTATVVAPGTATLASTSTLTAAAGVVRAGTASLTSTSTLTGSATRIVPASAALASTSALTAAGTLTIRGVAVLASVSGLTAVIGSTNQPGLLTASHQAGRPVPMADATGGLTESDTTAALASSMWP
jgi:fibronectin-binding autotransporter adhesin